MSKKIAFLLGITPNLAFAAGNVCLSINKYMTEDNYDIVIYYTELSKNDLNAFSKISHVKLKQFCLPADFISLMLAKMPDRSRFKSKNHLMSFCHFEVFALLDEYENVAWIDVDTGIQNDISHITRYSPFGITLDTPWKVGDQFSSPIQEYQMDIEGYCTAVMVVNNTLPYQQIHQWLYEKAIEYAEYLINPDQAIISIMMQHFNITPKLMPLEEWQCISWRKEAPFARIVHFGSSRKIWSDKNLCNAFPEWFRTHLEWLNLGGSDFDRSRIDPSNILGTLDHFDELITQEKLKSTKKYRLFGFLPIYKIKYSSKKTKHYLLSCIPFMESYNK